MAMSRADLLRVFPELKHTGYRKTSDDTRQYNCLAWAAGETHRRWDPHVLTDHWPARREQTIPAFKEAYESIGYVQCPDGKEEHGFEKIAIFAIGGKPQHAARQLGNGAWTSKLGRDIDIEHPTVDGVKSQVYGEVVIYMKRPIIMQPGRLPPLSSALCLLHLDPYRRQRYPRAGVQDATRPRTGLSPPDRFM
jgi:hypothetical protein